MSKQAFRVGALLALLLGMLPIVSVLAQGGLGTPQGELLFNRPVAGVLAASEAHVYTFPGRGGQVVSVSMESDNPSFDPVLELHGPGSNLLAFSDDTAVGESGARIAGVVLTVEGEYTLVVRSFGNAGSGAYALFATRENVVNAGGPGVGPGMAISFGETVVEAIDPQGQVDRWMFTGSAGQIVSIAMDHEFDSYLDPLLELLGPSGDVLVTSDDDGGNLNSLINGFMLPADGLYTILARSWGNSSTGGYSLTLSEGIASATGGLGAVGNTGNIEPGQTVQAVLAPGTLDEWTFVAEAGQIFSMAIYADADRFDTVLTLLDADNHELEYNDDGGPGLNSMIRGWTVPANGAYTIRVGSYSGSSGGDYSLAIESGDHFLVLESWRQGDLTLGETVEGTFQGGVTTHAWTFEAEADQFVVADYTAGDLSSFYMEVIGPDGEYYGYMESGLPLRIEEAGQYYLFVEAFGASDYTLTLREAEPPSVNEGSIEPDQTIEADLAPAATDLWTLVAEEGQIFSIALYADGNSFDTTLTIVDEDGREVAYNDDGATGLNSLLRAWEAPADGAYVIQVTSYSGRDGGLYALTVETGDRFVLPESWLQGPLPPDETVEGTFEDSGQTHVWTFEAGAGQSLRLDYTGSLYIEILDANGEYYSYFDPNQPITFDQSGLYYLVLQSYAAGDYTLEMTAVDVEADE